MRCNVVMAMVVVEGGTACSTIKLENPRTWCWRLCAHACSQENGFESRFYVNYVNGWFLTARDSLWRCAATAVTSRTKHIMYMEHTHTPEYSYSCCVVFVLVNIYVYENIRIGGLEACTDCVIYGTVFVRVTRIFLQTKIF